MAETVGETPEQGIAHAQGYGQNLNQNLPQPNNQNQNNRNNQNRNKHNRNNRNQPNPRPICDQTVRRYQINNPIRLPNKGANNFEIKSHLFGLIDTRAQFLGEDDEDPHHHLYLFEELCNTAKSHGAHRELTRMSLFPFSLKGRARDWFLSLPHHSLTSWEDIQTEFLKQYFTPGRKLELIVEIANFRQGSEETFENAWERFKKLLRACPDHGYSLDMQIQLFCRKLRKDSRADIDHVCGGSLIMSEAQIVYDAIEKISKNNRMWETGSSTRKVVFAGEYTPNTEVLAHLENLSRKFDGLQQNKNLSSGNSKTNDYSNHDNVSLGIEEPEGYSREKVNFLKHRNLNDAYSNSFNAFRRDHPTFRWSETPSKPGQPPYSVQYKNPYNNLFYQGDTSNQNLQSLPSSYPQHTTQSTPVTQSSTQPEGVDKWDKLMENLMGVISTQAQNIETMMTSIGTVTKDMSTLKTSMSGHNTRIRIIEASLRNLEYHLSREVERKNSKPSAGLPSNIERNLSGVNVVITRSGRICGSNGLEKFGNNEVDDDLDGKYKKNMESKGPFQTELYPAQPKFTSVQPGRASPHPLHILKKKVLNDDTLCLQKAQSFKEALPSSSNDKGKGGIHSNPTDLELLPHSPRNEMKKMKLNNKYACFIDTFRHLINY